MSLRLTTCSRSATTKACYHANSSGVTAAVPGRRTPLNSDPLGSTEERMEAEGTLSLIAEVSIAFAGFTSVVGVFGARGEHQWSSSQLSSLRLLIETSLIMLLTALLPLALYSTGLTTTESWRGRPLMFAARAKDA